MSITTIKTPTTAAIETAIKNADKMIAQGYTVEQGKSIPHHYFCIKPGFNGKAYYIVNVMPGFESCQCEQWKLEGVCKHQKFVADHIRYEEMAAIEEARAEEEAWADWAECRDAVEAEKPESDDDYETRICHYHGPHDRNLPWCARCEKLAY